MNYYIIIMTYDTQFLQLGSQLTADNSLQLTTLPLILYNYPQLSLH